MTRVFFPPTRQIERVFWGLNQRQQMSDQEEPAIQRDKNSNHFEYGKGTGHSHPRVAFCSGSTRFLGYTLLSP